MSSSNVDNGALVTSVATVVSTPLLDCAADSKSGRHDKRVRNDIKSSGFEIHEKLYPAKKDSHLVIFCEMYGLFTAVRNDA